MAESVIWQDIALVGSIFTRLRLMKILCPLVQYPAIIWNDVFIPYYACIHTVRCIATGGCMVTHMQYIACTCAVHVTQVAAKLKSCQGTAM